METTMKRLKLPETDSIDELARFWDTHDLTELEDQLEEVTEPIFLRDSPAVTQLRLEPQELAAVRRIAKARGVEQGDLLRQWVLERLRDAS
jgi:CopG antitoxin of type II toxin-antitoxin system